MDMLKSAFRYLILLMFPILIPGIFNGVSGQTPHPILRYFDGTVYQETVRLSWAISAGNTCLGTNIQRSVDGIFFENIAVIAGVCGSPDVDVQYVFTDETPVENQVSYYRLELGTQGFSTPIAVEYIPLNGKGFNLRYDRISNTAFVHFENSERKQVEFNLYTIGGQILFSGQTSGSVIEVNMSGMPAQLFVLTIQNDRSPISVKIPHF